MKNSIKTVFLALFTTLSVVGMDAPLALAKPTVASKNPELAFFEDLASGNLEQIKQYLDKTQRPINRCFEGPHLPPELVKARITPLMIASFNGHASIVSYLILEKKASPEMVTEDGDSAVSFCLKDKHGHHLPILKSLLENSSICSTDCQRLLEQVDSSGLNPLQNAIKLGDLDPVKYILDKSNFDAHIDGIVALSLAKTHKHPEVAKYLASKGVFNLPEENLTPILQNIFYNKEANKALNLELFDLISYNTQSIPPSTSITGLETGGTMQIFQPRVFEQAGKKEECTDAKLKRASEKLGGTPEMHKETSPIYGGTCSYHAMKNALLGLLLLEDYDALASQRAENKNITQQFVNADITNLTTLKTVHFDCELFAENLHAKIAVLNNATQAFMQAEAIAITQGAYGNNMLIAREIFDYTYNEQVSKRHSTLPSSTSKISFIDDQTIRALTTNYRIHNQNNSFTTLKDQDLISQIALFRKSNNYRHAFHFSLNTGELHGYGQSIGKSRMHAIAMIIDKRGSQVNVLVFESNNHAPFAIKQILFDFIALFIDESKKAITNAECESHAALAQDPFCITAANTVKSVCDIESLLNNYAQLESKCFASNKRDDISEALLCLSQIKHLQNILDNSSSNTSLEKLESLFKKHSINSDVLRAREIKLHTLLQSIENDELNERMSTFIMQKDPKRVKEAIQVGANPNYIDSNGNTALTTAVYHGLDIVKILVENNANVNGTNKKGKTPLMNACEQGNLEIIEYLIEHGAQINIQDEDGNTPLMYLAGFFNPDQTAKLNIAKELVEKYGANLDLKNKSGQDASRVHAICGSGVIFKYLIEKQNISLDLSTLVQCITQERVSLNCSFGPLFSPDPLIEYIVQKYDLKDKINQALILQIGIAAVKSAQIPTVKNLIDKKCLLNINAQDKQGWTLLMHASSKNNPGTLQKLIQELHADVNVKNHKGQTAYDISVEHLHLNNLDYFIKNHQYSINTHDCYGSNALHYAAAQCNFNTMRSLVEFYKADINKPDSRGRTALMLASGVHTPGVKCSAAECKTDQNSGSDNEDTGMQALFRRRPQGHLETVQFLVENGCDARVKEAQGLTALDGAKQAGRTNVVDYLNQHINNLPKEPVDKLS